MRGWAHRKRPRPASWGGRILSGAEL